MIKEAERHAAEDAEKKDSIEAINQQEMNLFYFYISLHDYHPLPDFYSDSQKA
jgi:DNA-binding ferritin-like protein